MATTLKAELSSRQSAKPDRTRTPWTASADHERWLSLLRVAMKDTEWSVDALAAHWAVDRGYVWCLVNGEKPWTVDRLLSLPDELEARFEILRAESFGAIVVTPLHGLEAQKAFVAGLIGVMSAPQLPARASGMARCEIPDADRKTGTR